jgi:tRNA(Ile)-lysidine synthase
MFAPGQRVGVAVSGGADSVCLVHVLRILAPDRALKLHILHLNHRLRGEHSRADEEFVGALAASLGLPFHSVSIDAAAAAAAAGDNLEQTARRLRREYFAGFLARGELDRVALGHTRSDQAETVLFRLLRGAGTAGLAAIRPLTREGFARPLIDIERREVLAWLRDRGIPWREDASNQDLAFARNRIRHVLLPELTRDWNPELAATLAGMARVALDEEAWWAGEVDRVVEGQWARSPAGPLLFRAEWLRSLDRALARRVIRRAIEQVKGDLRGINLAHVEAILELAGSTDGSGRLQVPEVEVFRSFDWMRIAPAGTYAREQREFTIPVEPPASVRLPGGVSVRLERTANAPTSADPASYNDKEASELDWGRIAGSLCLRSWRPGDHFRPVGYTCETKIKLLFQNARIPLWERRRWPVLTCGDQIVWVARFGPAADCAATPESRSVLRVRAVADATEI